MFTVLQTEEFVTWLDALADKRAQIRIAARLRQAEAGTLGDWQPVEGDVSEMRVHYGPGYRLYFVRRGRVIVVMLNAGDKGTQKWEPLINVDSERQRETEGRSATLGGQLERR
jgi:putative addiction module killer protein